MLKAVASFRDSETGNYTDGEIRVDLMLAGPSAEAYFALLQRMKERLGSSIGDPLN